MSLNHSVLKCGDAIKMFHTSWWSTLLFKFHSLYFHLRIVLLIIGKLFFHLGNVIAFFMCTRNKQIVA